MPIIESVVTLSIIVIKQSFGNLVLAAQAFRIILAKSHQKNTKNGKSGLLIVSLIINYRKYDYTFDN